MPPIKILLIDDDKDYYTLVQKMLARDLHLYNVEWASNYQMAKSIADRKQYDVFLVDYNLGDHNGLQLVQDLLNQGVQSPFIVLTGYTEPEFDLRVLEAGAADYIDKTEIKPTTLRRTIRYAMQRWQDMQALRSSEENYRMLLEDASDGILITDETANVTIANSAACDLLLTTYEDIVGKPLSTFIGTTNANTTPLHPNKMKMGETALIEYTLTQPQGERHLEISAKVLTGGKLQCILRDITQRKQAEVERERLIQQLTVLQEVDMELNHMLNIDYVLSLALDAAVRLSGANAGFIGTLDNSKIKLAQAIGRYANTAPGDILPDIPVVQQAMEALQGRLITDFMSPTVITPLNADSQALMVIPLISFDRPLGVLYMEARRPERFTQESFDFIKLVASRVAVAIENAQLYQIAQDQLARLQELYIQVSDLEKLKTDMIRIAAHDLRNPVGVIVGYLELLEWSLGEAMTDKQKNQINAMARAAQRMEKITTDILSLERIEKLHLEKTQVVDIKKLLHEAYDDLKGQAEEKGQQCTLEIADGELSIQADPAQIREAMANLISNAIKYTPNTGKISVKLYEESDRAVFEVIDNGFGIPVDQQAGLFQPFFRAASEETVGIEGTGLGLHLVKNIVTRHEGKMIFHSVYGEGSTFGFRLPLAL